MKSPLLTLIATCLFLAPISVLAELPAQLIADFSPIEGYVVMPLNQDELITDIDASKGLTTGDILSIVVKGKELVHPVSNDVIGTLDDQVTFLQATRLKSGYSYAQKIRGDKKILKGDRIKRFAQVPTLFLDPDGSRQNLKAELQQQLSLLDWLDNSAETSPLLTFEQVGEVLHIKDAGGATIRSYKLSGFTNTASKKATNTTATAKTTVSMPIAATITTSTSTNIKKNNQIHAVWNGPVLTEEFIAITVADFNSDGLQETAVLSRSKLIIGIFEGQTFKTITEWDSPSSYNFIALDNFDLNMNGRPEIFVSGLRDNEPQSFVFELINNTLQEKRRNIPMLFRSVIQSEQGTVLLGQKRRQYDIAFDQRPFKVLYNSGDYTAGATYSYPSPLNIYGSVSFIDQDNLQFFAHLNSNDYLTVKTADGNVLYESSERFGGTDINFELLPEDPTEAPLPYYIPMRILLDNGQLIIPQNEGTRLTQRFRKFTKGHLSALTWNGVGMTEVWRTADQEGQITDFALADIDNDGQREIALAVKIKSKGAFSKPRSAIIIHEMQ